MNRPSGAPPTDHPLLIAARYNDAEAEDHELREVVEKHGLDYDYLEYTAKQRALRVVLAQSGRLGEISRTEPVSVGLSDAERDTIDALIPLYIDAILLGWRASQVASND